VICPNCQTRVTADAVICDHCNFIMDATFLGEGITNQANAAHPAEDDSHTKVKAIAPKSPAQAAARDEPPVVGTNDQDDGEPRRSLTLIAAPPTAVSETVWELSEQFKAFPASERFSTIGAGVFLISLGLPWQWTEADDSTIGLVANAWPMGLLALFVVAAPFVRRQLRLRPFKMQVVTSTVAASLLTLVGTTLYISRSIAKEIIHVNGQQHEI
jgi:hypothetical protein